MCLSAYWQYKLANERKGISAVIVKKLFTKDRAKLQPKVLSFERCCNSSLTIGGLPSAVELSPVRNPEKARKIL